MCQIEQETVEPRISQRNREKRVSLSPIVKEQYHKAVGILQTEGNAGGNALLESDSIMTGDTEELDSTRTGENNGLGADAEEK